MVGSRAAVEVVRAWKAEGGTQSAFMRRHGLPRERLRFWTRRLEEKLEARPAPAFVPVELDPACFYVRVEKRPRLACPRCKQGVAAAPASEVPLPGALPGPGLLAQLLVGKYRDGLPLYRQQGIFHQRHGVKLPTSTLGEWVAHARDLLPPVVQLLNQRTLGDWLLHTDDTGVRVLDSEDARGIKRGHLWPYVGQGGNVFVEYTPPGVAGPQAVLANYEGYLVADGYAGYQPLFGSASPRVKVGCWMHARRGFERAHQAGDARGSTVPSLIQKLYAVERQAKEAKLSPKARLKLRTPSNAPPSVGRRRTITASRAWSSSETPSSPSSATSQPASVDVTPRPMAPSGSSSMGHSPPSSRTKRKRRCATSAARVARSASPTGETNLRVAEPGDSPSAAPSQSPLSPRVKRHVSRPASGRWSHARPSVSCSTRQHWAPMRWPQPMSWESSSSICSRWRERSTVHQAQKRVGARRHGQRPEQPSSSFCSSRHAHRAGL